MATNGNHPPNVPAAPDLEEALLGSVMIDPSCWPDVATLVHAGDFFILRHQIVWQAYTRLQSRGDIIDFLTVQDELRAMHKLQDVGGPGWVLGLVNNTPSSVHAVFYARFVQRAAVRRRLMKASAEMLALAGDENLSTEEALVEAERTFHQVIDSYVDDSTEHTMASMVNEMLEQIELAMNGQSIPAQATGFKELDDLLDGGLWRGDLITIAGRPSMGKSAMLLQLTLNAARVGARVGYHSLEMNAQSLVRRLAASESGINGKALRSGKLTQAQWQRLLAASQNIEPLPINVNDGSMQTPESVMAQARRWQMRYGLDLIVLDYIQILNGMGKFKGHERQMEIAYFMRSMKTIARTLNVPIVLAAQINRGVEARENKRPMLSDLRESGSIEQESDIVMFLYRDFYYNPDTLNPSLLEVIVAKQRNGQTGTVPLHYDLPTQKISNAEIKHVDTRSA